MPQGRQGGPGPTTATPVTGRGGPVASGPRIVTVQGERWEVPFDATDEQIAVALGAPPDQTPEPAYGGGATPVSEGEKAFIGAIPGMVAGGMGAASLLKEPARRAGGWLLNKAVPGLTSHQADIAIRRGAAPLLRSSITKLAGNPNTQKVMQEALPGRMGPSVANDVLAGGVGQAVGLPGWAYTAARLGTRPLPLSVAAQGVASQGARAGVGAVGGGLASFILNALTGGGE